jgi:hypothetical protein
MADAEKLNGPGDTGGAGRKEQQADPSQIRAQSSLGRQRSVSPDQIHGQADRGPHYPHSEQDHSTGDSDPGMESGPIYQNWKSKRVGKGGTLGGDYVRVGVLQRGGGQQPGEEIDGHEVEKQRREDLGYPPSR